MASVGHAKTQSRHPVHGSRRTFALRLTSIFKIGLASGVSYISMASSSQTMVHWSQPMHISSFTKATVPGPPLTLALASVRIEFNARRILAASPSRRASNSLRVVMLCRATFIFSRLTKRRSSTTADVSILQQLQQSHTGFLWPCLVDHSRVQSE